MPSTYYVAWWNLENLFDEENSPPPDREASSARSARDIAGLDAGAADRKGHQLASVIAQMNDGAGPDLLGVCEVENRFVLDLLVDASTPLPGRSTRSSTPIPRTPAASTSRSSTTPTCSRCRTVRCSSTW